MSTSSYDVPSSSQTTSMTRRASSQRWQPGLLYRVIRALMSLQEAEGAPALGGAQPALLHLAGDRVGQLLDHVDGGGLLEAGEALLAVAAYDVDQGVARAGGRRLHVGDHGLAGLRVLDADHGRLRHLGELGDHVLDLARVDVEPRDDDQLLDPVDEVEVAGGVEVADVARRPPPPAGGTVG